MKRNELEVGYLIEFRNGERKIVMPCDDPDYPIVLTNQYGEWSYLGVYTDSLLSTIAKKFDIVKVFGFSKLTSQALSFNTNHRELIWERKEKRKMTVAEIENILGYEVEIVRES